MEIFDLTKQLVGIPSFVSGDNNESRLGEFIYEYLRLNTKLIVEKQYVTKTRFNVFAYSKKALSNNKINLNYLLVNHIDTVEPKVGWQFNQFKGKEKGDKYFGLGSFDTKGNVAIMIKLAELNFSQTGFLFYIDEEYDFLGMQDFLKSTAYKVLPKNIISLDGSQGMITNACRGILEARLQIYGKTGHSTDQKNGNSASNALRLLFDLIDKQIATREVAILGKSTLNIAYMKAGLLLEDKSELGKQGNNIPDYAESVIEVRTNGTFTKKILRKICSEVEEYLGVKVDLTVNLDLQPWSTSDSSIKTILDAITRNGFKISFEPVNQVGYIDVAMLYEKYKVPTIALGVEGGNAHGVNEWMSKKSQLKVYQLIKSIVLNS